MKLDWFESLVTACLIIFYLFLLLIPINLATADLGRHIQNGEQIFLGNFDVLYQNYYSYTYPDFPFVNHHWLGGVIFYLVASIGGLSLVQLLFIVVNLSVFTIFFLIAKKYSNIYIGSIVALLIIPVIAYRDEVRPEVFSYSFVAIYYLVLKKFNLGQLSRKWLFLLPVLQLFWVNIHIYFFIGFFLLAAFWVVQLLTWLFKKGTYNLIILRDITFTGVLCLIASLCNPFFIQGLIYPLQIFGNYGYRVLENQSVLFLDQVITVPALLYFKLALVILALSWVYKLVRLFVYKEKVSWPDLILSVFFSVLAFIQVRNLELFGLFALVSISQNLANLKMGYPKYFLVPGLAIVVICLLVVNPGYWESRVSGFGPAPGIERAAEFFIRENIKGPVFNNYDIGGYLIYHLYPEEKVFVDNRPEGYPVKFFKEVYVPMQEDDVVWRQKEDEYKFNVIFFYRNDLTDWAQKFLINRIKDPEWVPVFVDNYNIIFLKRNEQNRKVIEQFQIPADMFKIN